MKGVQRYEEKLEAIRGAGIVRKEPITGKRKKKKVKMSRIYIKKKKRVIEVKALDV